MRLAGGIFGCATYVLMIFNHNEATFAGSLLANKKEYEKTV
jgi:hypothetical protein